MKVHLTPAVLSQIGARLQDVDLNLARVPNELTPELLALTNSVVMLTRAVDLLVKGLLQAEVH